MKGLNSCISLILLSVISLFIGACGNSDQSSGSTGSLAFGLVWKEPSAPSSKNLISAIPGDCSGVETVRVAVYDEGGTLLRSEDFPCSDHQGTVDNILAGSNRTIIIYGLNTENEILYWAQVPDVTISAGKTADLGTVDVDYAVPVANAIVGYRRVEISWANVAGATSYKIYLSESIGGEKTDSISDVTSPYTHAELPNPTAYYYVVTAVNSYGESAVSAEVPYPRFAYVANKDFNNVSMYTINPTTGALAPQITESTVAAGTEPVSVTVDPSGKFAYVANFSPPYGISGYKIDSTGKLTAIDGLPFDAGTQPRSVTVNPSGNIAYVANSGSKNVSVYKIDPITGELMEIPEFLFTVGNVPRSVTVNPSGNIAYVANEGSDSVTVCTIDLDTGELGLVETKDVGMGTEPRSVAVDPSGRFAYVANALGNSVSVYTIDNDPIPGALTLVETEREEVTSPWLVTVDPTGRFVYVANALGNSVSVYTINNTALRVRVWVISYLLEHGSEDFQTEILLIS